MEPSPAGHGWEPLVTILVPVFNRVDLVVEALNSVTGQTYQNYEVVVCDNGSTDGTWQVVEEFARKDGRIRVFRSDPTIPIVSNWIKCLTHSTGELVKILWSDDLMAADFLERTVPYLRDPEVGFVFSSTEIFSTTKSRLAYRIGETGVYPSSVFIEGSLFKDGFPLSPGCALFRRGDLERNLLEDIPNRPGIEFRHLGYGNDVLLFLLTATQYPSFAFVSDTLSFFRHHDSSISVQVEDGRRRLCYAVAKAYMVDNHEDDRQRISKFNIALLMLLLRYRNNSLGLRTLGDFYSNREKAFVSYRDFLEVPFGIILPRIKRRLLGELE